MIDNSLIAEMKALLYEAIDAPTKTAAKKPIKRLEFRLSRLREQLGGYLSEKLSDAIIYAKQASGSPRDKNHWVTCAKDAWSEFEMRVRK